MRSISASFLFVILSFTAHASGQWSFTLAQAPGAHSGECLRQPMGSAKANSILQRNGITQRGGYTQRETLALARGIERLEVLNKGPIPRKWRTAFTYVTSRSPRGRYTWNQAGHTVYVRRPRGSEINGENGTRLMHELGHKVGNSPGKGGSYYSLYNSFVKQKCTISIYCTHRRLDKNGRPTKPHTKRNEEFAEAFAAYLVSPSRLQQTCPQAYQFFATRVLPGVDALTTCRQGATPGLLGTSPGGIN